MNESMDQLVVIKTFNSLKPLMAKESVKQKLRLLYVFGFNGSEVIFATNEDKVYGCGHNQSGCLGLGVDTNISLPKVNPYLSGKGLAKLFSGFQHCIGVTTSGQTYSWGDNKYGSLGVGTLLDSNVPQLVHGLDDKHVVMASCGNSHTLVLTIDGHVYGFGRNLFGQLGDESQVSRPYACLITCLNDMTVMSVSCGRNHSLALTDTGRVYVWGLNICGQLGRHRDEDIQFGQQMPYCDTPKTVKGFTHLAKKAVCGTDHTLILTTDGHVYAFGDNNHGQVGYGVKGGTQFTPIRVKVAANIRFKDIFAYNANSLSIGVSTDDKYYVWGYQYIAVPRPTLELMTTHTIYDVFAIYCKTNITFETIIFDNTMNAINDNFDLNVDQKELYFKDKVFDDFNRINIRSDESVSDFNHKSVQQMQQNCGIDDSKALGIKKTNEELIPIKVFRKYLLNLFDNHSDFDLVFKFNDKSINCHKTLLQIRNKEFWQKCCQMLSKSDSICEIQIKSYSFEAFYAFLQFLYGLKPEINSNNRREVSKLATVYSELILQELCGPEVNEEVVIELSNICSLYERAVNEKSNDLEKSCIEFALKSDNLIQIVKSDAFRAMPDHLSQKLLASIQRYVYEK